MFSRFDVYWIQTKKERKKERNKQTDRQAKFIYRQLSYFSFFTAKHAPRVGLKCSLGKENRNFKKYIADF